MLYYYKSKVGVFWIRPSRHHYGRWELGFGDEVLGSYCSPDSAACDVYTHTTGCYVWDMLDGQIFNVPESVSEWSQSR